MVVFNIVIVFSEIWNNYYLMLFVDNLFLEICLEELVKML